MENLYDEGFWKLQVKKFFLKASAEKVNVNESFKSENYSKTFNKNSAKERFVEKDFQKLQMKALDVNIVWKFQTCRFIKASAVIAL